MHKANIINAVFFLLLILASCSKRNASETGSSGDTLFLYLDTAQVTSFIKTHGCVTNKEKLISFYKNRNYSFAWISNLGIHESSGSLMNLLENDTARGNGHCYARLQSLYNILFHLSKYSSQDSRVRELELLLTLNFLGYAKRNLPGINDEMLAELHGNLDRNKLNYEDLVKMYLQRSSTLVSRQAMVSKRFDLLRMYLKKYVDIEKEGNWPSLPATFKNDSQSVIPRIKSILYLTGDSPFQDTTSIMDEKTILAIKKFQARHGLEADGIVTKETYQAFRIPVRERIKQILINLERLRWVPEELEDDYIAINIPDFKLYAFHDQHLEWGCDVIVGKTNGVNQTVIFNDFIEYIVFSPYWNIPKRILREEVLPEIRKEENYIASHELEIVDPSGSVVETDDIDWQNDDEALTFQFRQRPGENNSLGLVKFLFPNPYGIYLHDTPQKSLFNETSRAFSHGCIRVEGPMKLAGFLLRNDKKWTEKKIIETAHSGSQTFVKLEKKVPVFIAYFTAWVGKDGLLQFREDIYGHDAKMKQLMFLN